MLDSNNSLHFLASFKLLFSGIRRLLSEIIFESLLKGLGKRINLVGSPPKKDQTPKELGQGYVLELKNNYERTGIAFLEYDKDTGVPIPISKDSLRRILIRDGFTSR